MEKEDNKKKSGPSDYLANERTFLAWIRTSLAFMGFGFVLVKFSLFFQHLSLAFGKSVSMPSKGYSPIIGIIMVAFGALMATLAFIRFQNIQKQLEQNVFFPSKWLSFLVTISIVIGTILLIIYLLPNK